MTHVYIMTNSVTGKIHLPKKCRKNLEVGVTVFPKLGKMADLPKTTVFKSEVISSGLQ